MAEVIEEKVENDDLYKYKELANAYRKYEELKVKEGLADYADLISNTLEVVKLTSIASVVALPELLFQARQAQSVTYNASPIVAAAIIYFILLWPVVRLLSRLENKQLAERR